MSYLSYTTALGTGTGDAIVIFRGYVNIYNWRKGGLEVTLRVTIFAMKNKVCPYPPLRVSWVSLACSRCSSNFKLSDVSLRCPSEPNFVKQYKHNLNVELNL